MENGDSHSTHYYIDFNILQRHDLNIINFFEKKATNAAVESFKTKIKAFRAQFRGVRDKTFFLYRLAKLYA